MNVPLDTMHVPSYESGDIFVSSKSSQLLSVYNFLSPPGYYSVVHAPVQDCLWANYTSSAILVFNTDALVLFVPYLGHSQQQPYPTYHFEYQHTGLDLEYFLCNLSGPQTLDNDMSMAIAALPATPPNGVPKMANGGTPSSTFVSPIIIGSQMPPPMHSLAIHDSPPYPLSPEVHSGLQAPRSHQSQRPACPVLNCHSTFKRQQDLKRHASTVHGLKKNCPHNSCRYKTGRKDKMVEHARKLHGKA